MKIFTREEMNHEDIDRAFKAHQPKNKKIIKPDNTPTTQATSSPDNFLIMIILVLLLLEMKEK
ncbi:MAG: hypothetical protein RR427_06600 [Cellulosilyticaceae bacterium]